MKNIVGFASDGASVMLGRKSSVMTRLKTAVPQFFTLHCVCHSLALCASTSCTAIPKDVESLLTDVYSYFKYSSVRTQNLGRIVEFMEVDVKK